MTLLIAVLASLIASEVSAACNMTVSTSLCGTVQTASDDAGNCTGINQRCSCIAYCAGSSLVVSCDCETTRAPGGFPGAGPFERETAARWHASGPNVSLSDFGGIVESVFQWGVAIVDGAGVDVKLGNYDGAFEDILDAYGSANGFSVSWDDAHNVITFTGD